ncbi:hypothetical protein P3342_007238 [Pyrenophora teres f. teres]|uniref:Uncharacterized protein n=2 Tax=Pyrenophora teres f. teres TaxID=97479 RepID=E3S8S2_PYRTT|nr:hypothetical protein PTT_19406 [Pyrenophora teres f. teres 0-1]KAE8833901.1 hypothetical protein HRS9139_05720 [Pyrenophora teres f. teres]KAE8840327.1 hypothetical protein PTNB85_03726 [Pyrenophora teres f. teres]KAE8849533.1 hypothetical protein HRS9122_03549 [Pyrenophora teres f. teres]KAE8863826.1 hypothetical protein PTNB29_03790 [Pyrenophora teres f. teres]
MRYGIAYLLLQLVALSTAQWDNNSTAPIELAPAPWTLKGTVYTVTFVPLSTRLPTKAYAPLERQYASAVEGKYIGILGQIQIIRYTDSPVGPYDELLIVPGFFKYNYTDASGKKEEKKNVRVSRIYVSQKYTCWNGRTNWNIPKHLARFDWVEKGNGETTVKVYPHDTTGDLSESKPAEKPWFQATFKPNLPIGIPFSTDLYGLLGVNTTLAQPPLPSGNGSYDELPGTDHWAATVPNQVTNRATLGIVDMKQGDGDVEEGRSTNAVGDEYFPNFWPGIPRLNVASKLEDATVTFSAPEIWKN